MTYASFKILEINWMGSELSPYRFTVKVELTRLPEEGGRSKTITLNMGDDYYPNENSIKEAVESHIEREERHTANRARTKSLLGKVIDL